VARRLLCGKRVSMSARRQRVCRCLLCCTVSPRLFSLLLPLRRMHVARQQEDENRMGREEGRGTPLPREVYRKIKTDRQPSQALKPDALGAATGRAGPWRRSTYKLQRLARSPFASHLPSQSPLRLHPIAQICGPAGAAWKGQMARCALTRAALAAGEGPGGSVE
jgi:hypothetical protein